MLSIPVIYLGLIGTLVAMGSGDNRPADQNFADDVARVQKRVPAVVLSCPDSEARILVAPTLQGRVLTSTTGGADGPSFGWINFRLLDSGHSQPHINAFGGEDRIWLGPEGGQFGLFFPPSSPFDYAHWQTPAALDSEPFDVVKQESNEIVLRKDVHLTNYSGTHFNACIDRKIRILAPDEIWSSLKLPPQKGIRAVAFESVNKLTNLGPVPWRKSGGLLSIWTLGMFNASPQTTVMIPYLKGPESELGPVLESDYFGTVPDDRLKEQDDMIYFTADAHYRSKIGLSPKRALSVMGSYDTAKHLLTILQFSSPERNADYVNSKWEQQVHPFNGSVVNSYNDGPNDTGTSLGNFYEMESSSPALALAPNESASHFQRTIHLSGNPDTLNFIARQVLGANISSQLRTQPSP